MRRAHSILTCVGTATGQPEIRRGNRMLPRSRDAIVYKLVRKSPRYTAELLYTSRTASELRLLYY